MYETIIFRGNLNLNLMEGAILKPNPHTLLHSIFFSFDPELSLFGRNQDISDVLANYSSNLTWDLIVSTITYSVEIMLYF